MGHIPWHLSSKSRCSSYLRICRPRLLRSVLLAIHFVTQSHIRGTASSCMTRTSTVWVSLTLVRGVVSGVVFRGVWRGLSCTRTRFWLIRVAAILTVSTIPTPHAHYLYIPHSITHLSSTLTNSISTQHTHHTSPTRAHPLTT